GPDSCSRPICSTCSTPTRCSAACAGSIPPRIRRSTRCCRREFCESGSPSSSRRDEARSLAPRQLQGPASLVLSGPFFIGTIDLIEMAARSTPRRPGDSARRAYFVRWTIAIALVAVPGAAAWRAFRPNRVQRPNLLLITIDTLRADHVGVYGSQSGATPALDALAARGVRFDQVQTAAPLTGPSHATILTGEYPPTHGVRS